MDRRARFFLILLFATSSIAASGRYASAVYELKPEFIANRRVEPKARPRPISLPPAKLPEHEELNYDAHWLAFKAGTITASIKGIKTIRGRDAYEIEVVIKTAGLLKGIRRVDDRFVSYIDRERLYSLRHEQYRMEGRNTKHTVTDFDQVKHRAHFVNLLDKTEADFEIPPDVQDMLTASYFLRAVPIPPDGRFEYNVFHEGRSYKLFGTIEEIRDIRVPGMGVKEAFYIQPYSMMKNEEPKKVKVRGYFSYDEKRKPLVAVVKAPLFTEVVAYLKTDSHE